MSAAVATRGVIRSQIEWGRCSHCTWMPSEPDDDAALEHALPGGRRGTSSTGAGGRGVSAFDLLQGAGQDPRWRRSRPSLGARSFSPRCRGPQGPAPVGRGPSGPLRTPRASAAPALLRLKLQRPLFGFHETYAHSEIHMLSMFPRKDSRLSLPIAASAITASTKQTRISMFSLSLSRRQWAGCTAAQAKPSRHDKTIVVQPCSHPMPSPILEKVRKK